MSFSAMFLVLWFLMLGCNGNVGQIIDTDSESLCNGLQLNEVVNVSMFNLDFN